MRGQQLRGYVLPVCEQETLPPILQYGVRGAVRRHTVYVCKPHVELMMKSGESVCVLAVIGHIMNPAGRVSIAEEGNTPL